MLPADWEEYLAQQEWVIKQSPVPTKRHQPKVTRMRSRRQQIAESQTSNSVRAVYQPESKWNETPTMPEEWRGIEREVGPGDPSQGTYRAGKATVESPTGYSKVRPRHRHRHVEETKDLDDLLKEYEVE